MKLYVWEWDISTTTHDRLRKGETEAHHEQVTVIAPSEHTAWELATWMVISSTGNYVSRTTLTDVRECNADPNDWEPINDDWSLPIDTPSE